ncbi:glycoside hydrolase family 43 protein [Sphingobacterium sp. lm-10]|uniref:glycoside hydrolase family 43 protein n=1 Tax=Sphingobacterium sp. lm-10 TaxID=2944904 RepID=UPI002021341C|nr:glycoside hydrolase family 43 protein [Sphingobacterium sp. lm-10]MCL7987539.1 glycoside hydrolase family 43 protein [Sphingobacterium sp. lm-10]
MKLYLFFFLWLFVSLASCNRSVSEQAQPSNPLDVPFGDPYVLYDKASDRYYMYGTGGVDNGFAVYASDDMTSWEKEGTAYSNNQEHAWGVKDFWAPEVYEHNGKYYLFYSAHWKDNPNNELENYRIGVAEADTPLGPFIDRSSGPIFDPGYPIIDANLYFADNGKVYMYYSRCCYKHAVESEISEWAKEKGLFDTIEESWIYGIELAADFSRVVGEPVLLLRPPVNMADKQSEWESRSVTSGEVNRRWTEGSYLFKEGQTYYMMYSANYFGGENYAVGYATSTHPLGPFEKSANNPILQKNTQDGGIVTGTGHNSLVKDRTGTTWCVYHGRTNKTGDQRLAFIDRLLIDDAGNLRVEGPTVNSKD